MRGRACVTVGGMWIIKEHTSSLSSLSSLTGSGVGGANWRQ